MSLYEGPSDPTRLHPEEIIEKDVGAKINAITYARGKLRGTRLVPAFHKDLPPIEVIVCCSVSLLVRYFLFI